MNLLSQKQQQHQRRPSTGVPSGFAATDKLLPFEFYWTRPLGAPDTRRRWTVVYRGPPHSNQTTTTQRKRRTPSVWACPLRSWADVERAFHGDSNSERNTSSINTLEVEGAAADWQALVQQQPQLWRNTLALLAQTCPRLERVVFLWHQNDDDDKVHDMACRLLEDLVFFGPTRLCLRHVEFLDDSLSPRNLLSRLTWLSKTAAADASKSSFPLESIRWDTNGLLWNMLDTNLDETEDSNPDNVSVTAGGLANAWVALIRQHHRFLREVTFLGATGWRGLFGGDGTQSQHRRLELWRALEQASCLELVDLGISSVSNESLVKKEDEVQLYLSFLRRLHWAQRLVGDHGQWKARSSTASRTQQIALYKGQAAAAALHVVEAWYVESDRPKILFTPEEEEEKKKQKNNGKQKNDNTDESQAAELQPGQPVGTSLTDRIRLGYRVRRSLPVVASSTSFPVSAGPAPRPFVQTLPTPAQRRVLSLAHMLQSVDEENRNPPPPAPDNTNTAPPTARQQQQEQLQAWQQQQQQHPQQPEPAAATMMNA